MGCNLDSVFPECLGCGVTVAESATYCRKCSLAIKAHQHATQGRDRLDAEAADKRSTASDWPIEERGDRPGQWYERMSALELPRYDEQDREEIIDRARRHDWAASQKRHKRRVGKAG
jgi:hypothetical protein